MHHGAVYLLSSTVCFVSQYRELSAVQTTSTVNAQPYTYCTIQPLQKHYNIARMLLFSFAECSTSSGLARAFATRRDAMLSAERAAGNPRSPRPEAACALYMHTLNNSQLRRGGCESDPLVAEGRP